ncbi:MAG: 50S ribosomal protein L23 [Saprospiraceae bacterium]|nr:50S ribosomal protein L23 [Saprospiraceae bacterium]
MARSIIIKPMLSEKAESLAKSLNKYTFIVDKSVNKITIKKEIEKMYGVNVKSVNTLVMPSKSKARNTRSGLVRGVKPSFKKAIISLPVGEEIDIYGAAENTEE